MVLASFLFIEGSVPRERKSSSTTHLRGEEAVRLGKGCAVRWTAMPLGISVAGPSGQGWVQPECAVNSSSASQPSAGAGPIHQH